MENQELYFANPFIDREDKQEGFLYRLANKEVWSGFIDGAVNSMIRDQLITGCVYKDDKKDDILDWFGMRCLCW